MTYTTRAVLINNIRSTAALKLKVVAGSIGIGVDIIDQDYNVIDHVGNGGTYQVEVLSEITDDEDLNTATIIDPLQ